MLDLKQAKAQAQLWWGIRGTAVTLEGRRSVKYVVGLTTLSARLGGRISTQYGTSWFSFEEAFAHAERTGHGPVNGFEGDDAIEDEA